MKRRDFLKRSAMLGAASACPQLLFSAPAMANSLEGYKAIIVISLNGGNDGFNTIVATEQYDSYSSARQALALPLPDLIPIQSTGPNDLALHPSLEALAPLFDSGQAVPVLATGQCRGLDEGGLPIRPSGSGNHTNMLTGMHTGFVNGEIKGGWAGRATEHVTEYNTPSPHPLFGSVQTNRVTQGETYKQEVITSEGVPSGFLKAWSRAPRLRATNYDLTNPRDNIFMRHSQDMLEGFTTPKPEFIPIFENERIAGFPDTGLGNKLERIARVILHQQDSVGHNRQVFACEQGGYDTHSGQLESQGKRLKELGDAIAAFHNVMIETGRDKEVALVTISDFGRKFYSNGGGSGHGWATNKFVVSGALRPFEQVGVLDYSKGDQPTTPCEQVLATLVHWFGVPENELEFIFPWLSKMDTKHLGFMGQSAPEPDPEALPIAGAVASHEHIDHSSGIVQVAERAIDGDVTTKWSGKGYGVTFEASLAAAATISHIRLRLPNSSWRQYMYLIEVLDAQGTVYEVSQEYTPLTNGDYDWIEIDCRTECRAARTLRITHFGNTDERDKYRDFTGIAELEIWGNSQ